MPPTFELAERLVALAATAAFLASDREEARGCTHSYLMTRTE